MSFLHCWILSSTWIMQGYFYLILVVIALCNLLAFSITGRFYFVYLAISFTLLLGTYLGYYRTQIKKKFNIKVSILLDSSIDVSYYIWQLYAYRWLYWVSYLESEVSVCGGLWILIFQLINRWYMMLPISYLLFWNCSDKWHRLVRLMMGFRMFCHFKHTLLSSNPFIWMVI